MATLWYDDYTEADEVRDAVELARMASTLLAIDADGSARALYSDDDRELYAALGAPTVTRASHVEPCADGWAADLSPVAGPVLGPYATRADALAAEVAWITANILSGDETR